MTINSVSKIAPHNILQSIIESGVLGSSKNQRELLKFLLDHHFNSGSGAGLNTKIIAQKVFGRDDSFKTKTDSIVRVEMHRLRTNLENFNDLSQYLKIELPKSSYKLEITQIEPAQKKTEPRLKGKRGFYSAGLVTGIGVLLLVFATAFNRDMPVLDCSQTIPNLGISVTGHEVDLTSYIHQVILSTESQYKHFNIVKDAGACDHNITPGYELTFALLKKSNRLQGNLTVTSLPLKKVVGSADLSERILVDKRVKDELYFQLARITNDTLRPSGVIHRHAVSQNWQDDAILLDYSCLIKMHDSFVSDSNSEYYSSLRCLEKAYENGTSSLENVGALAASYLEQVQGNRKPYDGSPLKNARIILNDVGDRWLLSPETTLAKIMHDSIPNGFNPQRLRETLLRAEQTYVAHPAILLDVARYSGFILGEWDTAKSNAEKVKLLASSRDNSIYQVDAAYAVLFDNVSDGWKNCIKAYSEASKVSNLLVHACAIKYNKQDWVEKTHENLTKLGLTDLEARRSFMREMGFESGLLNEILKLK